MEFIGEVIPLETEGDIKRPARFTWRGRAYRVVRIIHSWQDYSMPSGVRKKNFRMRHHRNYYHVETEGGERFEIYLDRGAKRPEWVLLKQLDPVPLRGQPRE